MPKGQFPHILTPEDKAKAQASIAARVKLKKSYAEGVALDNPHLTMHQLNDVVRAKFGSGMDSTVMCNILRLAREVTGTQTPALLPGNLALPAETLSTLKFLTGAPPAIKQTRTGKDVILPILEGLMNNPGKWAIVWTAPKNCPEGRVSSMGSHFYKQLHDGGAEVVVRGRHIYARMPTK